VIGRTVGWRTGGSPEESVSTGDAIEGSSGRGAILAALQDMKIGPGEIEHSCATYIFAVMPSELSDSEHPLPEFGRTERGAESIRHALVQEEFQQAVDTQ
jgi:hypothetical protein